MLVRSWRYHVCTTPAAVTDLAMADVKQTEVTVKWSPPKPRVVQHPFLFFLDFGLRIHGFGSLSVQVCSVLLVSGNDHGAPVVGYKISILLDPQPNELPEWYTLCECTKSLNPLRPGRCNSSHHKP